MGPNCAESQLFSPFPAYLAMHTSLGTKYMPVSAFGHPALDASAFEFST